MFELFWHVLVQVSEVCHFGTVGAVRPFVAITTKVETKKCTLGREDWTTLYSINKEKKFKFYFILSCISNMHSLPSHITRLDKMLRVYPTSLNRTYTMFAYSIFPGVCIFSFGWIAAPSAYFNVTSLCILEKSYWRVCLNMLCNFCFSHIEHFYVILVPLFEHVFILMHLLLSIFDYRCWTTMYLEVGIQLVALLYL